MSFGGIKALVSGEVNAIDRLLNWSGRNTKGFPWQLREFRNTTPFLDFVQVGKYGLIVVPRKRRLILIFGASGPSSSPTELTVGDYKEEPSVVVNRIHTAVAQYSKQCLDSGDIERAGSYARVLDTAAEATGDVVLRQEAATILFRVGRKQLDSGELSRSIQTFLHLGQYTFKELGDPQREAEMYYYQGVAAQRLEAKGDTRFDTQFYFELSIKTFPPGIESEILDDAKKRLAEHLVQKASDLGDADRLNELGEQFEQQGQDELAEQMYRKTAELGSSVGIVGVGVDFDFMDAEQVLSQVRAAIEELQPDSQTRTVSFDGEEIGFSFQVTEGMRAQQYWDSADSSYTVSFVVDAENVDVYFEGYPRTPVRAMAHLYASILETLLDALLGEHSYWVDTMTATAALYPSQSRGAAVTALEQDLDKAVRRLVALSLAVTGGTRPSRSVLGPHERAQLRRYAAAVVELGDGLKGLGGLLDRMDRDD